MLWTLIEQKGGGTPKRILLAGAISGAANAGVLAIVNTAAEKPEQPSLVLLGMLFAAIALYALSLRLCVGTLSGLIEAILREMRIRIVDKIRRAELLGLESVGNSEILERLTQQTNEISSSTWPICMGVQSIVMLVFSVLYLAYLAPTALLLTAAIYGGTAVLYYFRERSAQAFMQQTAKTRVGLLDVLSDLLRGFKEARFRSQRGKAIQDDFVGYAEALEQGTIQTNLLQQGNFVFANVCQFVLLGSVIFIMPLFVETNAQSAQKITAALLFMFGPIGGVLFGLPAYSRANLACQNVFELENKLDAMAPPPPSVNPSGTAEPFRELELVEVEFARKDASGQPLFTVGPISLSVRAGEIVFLVGGNGSGKTTLLRTLTALYPPTGGTLRVNGVPVTPRNAQSYREMIAAIFTDFHLFKKLYGLPDAEADKAQQLLAQMEIADKTYLADGVWSTVDLSTGQRKRIAMVVALLEDRPIYIFDEWAADQDPEFRRYFYEVLLQNLKKQGKAVIAISHDDRYFHCADRVITLEYGKVRSIEQHGNTLAAAPPSGPPPA